MNAFGPLFPNARPGFSLLEVLVACGILVVGLASMAAILPAAGSRLGEAAAQDRAVAAAAVAMSEIRCRNLSAADMFPVSASGTTPPIMFGETLSLAVTDSVNSLGYAPGITATGSLTSGSAVLSGTLSLGSATRLTVANAIVLGSRIHNNTDADNRRGYFLEDEVQYQPSPTSDVPRNWFAIGTVSGSGVRQFNRGICWGAMITPLPRASGSMTSAKVSVAVFRKPGAATAIGLRSLDNNNTGVFVSGTNTPLTLQRTLLKPCSTVLAIPPATASPAVAPQWLSIRSSWILTGTMAGVSGTAIGVSGTSIPSIVSSGSNVPTCVTFSSLVPSTLLSSGSLTVIAFENLLLVNEQTLSLQ